MSMPRERTFPINRLNKANANIKTFDMGERNIKRSDRRIQEFNVQCSMKLFSTITFQFVFIL